MKDFKKVLNILFLCVGLISFALMTGLGGCNNKITPTNAVSSEVVSAKQLDGNTPCPPPNQMCPCSNNTPLDRNCPGDLTPTPTFTPTPLATPTFTPTPNLSVCAQCDVDFAERNSDAFQDYQSELLKGSENCNGIFGGIPPPIGVELLDACNLADEGVATIIYVVKLFASTVQHDICLTDNNCP